LSSSNLPILIIETDGGFIPDEIKAGADLKIIYNGPGELNRITDEPTEYNGRIGIELRGQTSKDLFPKKPYSIETRDESGANNNVSLLGMPKENDWVLHNPYSDKSLIRNALTYILAGEIMEYAPRVRMVEVLVDGDYKGVYLLTEKVKRDKNRVNISKLKPDSEDITGGYILKFDKGQGREVGFVSPTKPISGRSQETRFLWHYPKFDEITDPQATYIKNFINDFETVLLSESFADSLEGYSKYIDVETFINYLFINEIGRNVDGYRLSTFMYKDRDEKDGRLKMGPVWDFNLAFGNANYCEGGNFSGWGHDFNSFCPDDYWVIHFWWKRLLADPAFKKQIKERWNKLRTQAFKNEAVFNTIDSLQNLLTINGAAQRNFDRWDALGQWVWPNNYVGQTYAQEITFLTNWTRDRLNWLDQAFNQFSTTPNSNTGDEADNIIVYPNPANGSTVNFEYTFNSRFVTKIKIYNAVGQFITELTTDENEERNKNKFTWSNLPPAGVYFYIVESFEGIEFSGKVILLGS
jgi:hypothetical protein